MQERKALEKKVADLEAKLDAQQQEAQYAYQRPSEGSNGTDADSQMRGESGNELEGQALTPEIRRAMEEIARDRAERMQERWERDTSELVKQYPELAHFKDAAVVRRDNIYTKRAIMPQDTLYAEAFPQMYAELKAAKAEIAKLTGGASTAAGGQSGTSRPVGDRGDDGTERIRSAQKTFLNKDASKADIRRAQRRVFDLE